MLPFSMGCRIPNPQIILGYGAYEIDVRVRASPAAPKQKAWFERRQAIIRERDACFVLFA
jgi:hypothetical protein